MIPMISDYNTLEVGTMMILMTITLILIMEIIIIKLNLNKEVKLINR